MKEVESDYAGFFTVLGQNCLLSTTQMSVKHLPNVFNHAWTPGFPEDDDASYGAPKSLRISLCIFAHIYNMEKGGIIRRGGWTAMTDMHVTSQL